jgi:hypothetical protein
MKGWGSPLPSSLSHKLMGCLPNLWCSKRPSVDSPLISEFPTSRTVSKKKEKTQQKTKNTVLNKLSSHMTFCYSNTEWTQTITKVLEREDTWTPEDWDPWTEKRFPIWILQSHLRDHSVVTLGDLGSDGVHSSLWIITYTKTPNLAKSTAI